MASPANCAAARERRLLRRPRGRCDGPGQGKAIVSIQKNEAFYGEVDILGKSYITGYEPIRGASKNVIGIYYVGYLK